MVASYVIPVSEAFIINDLCDICFWKCQQPDKPNLLLVAPLGTNTVIINAGIAYWRISYIDDLHHHGHYPESRVMLPSVIVDVHAWSAVPNQQAISAYYTNKQILYFGFTNTDTMLLIEH